MTKEVEFEWHQDSWLQVDLDDLLLEAAEDGLHVVEAMTARERVFWIPPWSSSLGEIAENQLGVMDQVSVEYQESSGIFWTYIRRRV